MQSFLTSRKRTETSASLIDLASVWGAKEGDPNREDLLAVVSAGLEALVNVKKIELSYSRRMVEAMNSRDTSMMVAAVYGLECDLRGGKSAAYGNERDFFHTMLMRAARICSKGEIQRWLKDDNYFASRRDQRALMEYLDEKLAALDTKIAQSADLKASEPEPELGPRM